MTIAIAPAIAEAEQQRAMRKPPGSLDAWAAYQRGWWHFGKAQPQDNALAEKYFQRAIDLDPAFVGGYGGLAWVHIRAATAYQTRGLTEAQRSAETLARQAVALDASDAEARSCLGQILLRRGDYVGALTEAGHALTINPNLTSAYELLGATLYLSGETKEGLAALRTAIRLDPHSPGDAQRLSQVAAALYLSGEYQAAVEALGHAIRTYPDFPMSYRWLAAALGQLGRTDGAGEALERALAIAPDSFNMFVRNRVPWMRPEDHDHMLEGLRKAGWRE